MLYSSSESENEQMYINNQFLAIQSVYLVVINSSDINQTQATRGPTVFNRIRKNNPLNLTADVISNYKYQRFF